MRITTRITLLLLFLTALCAALVANARYVAQKRLEVLVGDNINSKNTVIDRILKLHAAPCEAFVYDFSNRDDMCAFVARPDSVWADRYLKSMLHSANISATWVFDRNFTRVYAATVNDALQQCDVFAPEPDFMGVLGQRYFHHFFLQTACGVLELFCAPIQPSEDRDRTSQPQGYLFAGRLWDANYITEVSNISDSIITVRPILPDFPIPKPLYDFENGRIFFSRVLLSWNKRPVFELRVASDAPIFRGLGHASRENIVRLLVFFALVLVVLTAALVLWVQMPLRTLTQSLAAGDPARLAPLRRQKTEYGRLARLIEDFFSQGKALRSEIAERIRALEELEQAHSQLSAREEELQATNEELMAQQQMLNTMNKELLASNQQLRASQEDIIRANRIIENTFDAALDGFIYAEMSGVIVKVNRAMAMMLGSDIEACVGKHIAEFVPQQEPYRSRGIEFMSALKRDGFVKSFETALQAVGRIVDVEISAVYIPAEDGDPVGVLLCIRDITEQKLMQEHIRQAQKMEAIGTLAGGVAHDFNNILAAIMGYAELSRNRVEQGGVLSANLDKIIQSCTRARDLVRQILTFSRRDEGERTAVSMNEIVAEAVKLLRATIPSDIEIKLCVPNTAIFVNANPTHMHQLLMNLCTNAAQAMSENGGLLEIELAPCAIDASYVSEHFVVAEGDYVRLCVRDTGSGIAPENLRRIFDPFFTTKEIGKGTGMGLAVVYGIVKNHGGDIRVASVPGRGATFEILLPISKPPAAALTEDMPRPLPGGTERILFIDDEQALVDLCRELLTSLGYTVTAYGDVREALAAFENAPDLFDLVITDQTMPYMTGDRFAKRLLEVRPGLPIILCTGYSERLSDDAVAAIGISALLTKPIRMMELAQTIRSVLDGRATRA